MAFPAVEGTAATDFTTNATAHVADMPAGVASGDLLIAFAAFDRSGVETISPPSGWTTEEHHHLHSTFVTGIFMRVADGNEGATATFTTVGSEQGSIQIYRISGWSANTAHIRTLLHNIGVAGPNGLNGSALALTPFPVLFDAVETLWLIGSANSSLTPVGAIPAGFTDEIRSGAQATSSAALVTARRTEDAVVLDALAHIWSGTNNNALFMVSIPTSVGGGGGDDPVTTAHIAMM